MVTKVADRAFLDTNVLLAATDEGRREHAGALAILNEWPAAGTVLYASGQVLREYLAVATRPEASNGLGLDQRTALENVRALRAALRPLDETVRVTERLLGLLDEVECAGKQVHDANLVATMLVHGIQTLATINVSDFKRFVPRIVVVPVPM